MKILELFSGSKSFASVAKELGHEVFTVDIESGFKPDLVKDILLLMPEDIPFKPDVIWASPPCTYFSVASIGHHWNKDNTPKTKEAYLGMTIVKKTLELIEQLKPKYFYIENPRGKLRKLDFMLHLPRTTVTYCQYGDTRKKPTDIWTNDINWNPKPICKNGDPCHESSPRGSKTGTQGLKGSYERSKVPRELCLEILQSIGNIKILESAVKNKQQGLF